MNSLTPLWNDLAARAGLALSPEQQAKLSRYLDLLYEANASMNLTRIADRAAAEVQHIGDALTLLLWLPPGPHSLADVGSGGGVPGLPLAIARPDVQILLIESTQKKAAFLRRAAGELGLSNVEVTDQRAEEVGLSGRRESFDVVTVRAVATLDWLVEWCLPMLKKRGLMLAMKGPRASEELPGAAAILRPLGGDAPALVPADLPGHPGHIIVRVAKAGKTAAHLPRHPTQAKGKPLTKPR